MVFEKMAFFIIGVLALSSTSYAIVAEVVSVLPPGFPWLGGVCGVGVSALAFTVGLNCGGAETNGASFGCWNAPGGRTCNVTFKGEAEAFRWVNAGSFDSALDGACQTSAHREWPDIGAVYLVAVELQCSVERFVPDGACLELDVVPSINFRGELAPERYVGGGEGITIC